MINCNKALKLTSKGFNKYFKKELKKLEKEINRRIKSQCSMGLHYAHVCLDDYCYIKEEGVIDSVIEKIKKKGYNVVYRKPDFISIVWKDRCEDNE